MIEELKITQDLRVLMSDVRDQGPRPLCLAFAASDLNAVSNKLSHPLSVEFLAYHAYLKEGQRNYNIGLTTRGVIKTLTDIGQPDEAVLPYDINAYSPKIPHQNIHACYYASSSESVDVISAINKQLNNGAVTIACISLPPAFMTITHPFMIDDEYGDVGLHAVVVVGKGSLPCGKKYYLIRNSWGKSWADNGHCWLSENFINNRTVALIEVSHLNESH